MPLQPGTSLGPYQIDAPLGAGGMGEVYKATDTRLDRTVAIKVLPEHVAADPDLRQRFEREARTVAALNQPNIGHRMRIAHITQTVLLGCLLNLTASAAEPQRGSAQQTESTLAAAARRAREAASESESDSSRVYSNDNLFPRARLTVGAARDSSQDQAREPIQPAREPLQEEAFEPALFLSGAPPIIPLMAVGGGQEWLRVSVNATGTVTGIVPLLEAPGFSDPMQTAVRRWAFIPARLNGEPTDSEVFVAAVFRPAALYTLPGFGTPASSATRGPAEFAFPTETPPPLYPPGARDSGVVMVEVEVDVDGTVGATTLMSSSPGFDSSALITARRWHFQPARRLGRPVPSVAYLVFSFRSPILGSGIGRGGQQTRP